MPPASAKPLLFRIFIVMFWTWEVQLDRVRSVFPTAPHNLPKPQAARSLTPKTKARDPEGFVHVSSSEAFRWPASSRPTPWSPTRSRSSKSLRGRGRAACSPRGCSSRPPSRDGRSGGDERGVRTRHVLSGTEICSITLQIHVNYYILVS
jgi:hypothetical protein